MSDPVEEVTQDVPVEPMTPEVGPEGTPDEPEALVEGEKVPVETVEGV